MSSRWSQTAKLSSSRGSAWDRRKMKPFINSKRVTEASSAWIVQVTCAASDTFGRQRKSQRKTARNPISSLKGLMMGRLSLSHTKISWIWPWKESCDPEPSSPREADLSDCFWRRLQRNRTSKITSKSTANPSRWSIWGKYESKKPTKSKAANSTWCLITWSSEISTVFPICSCFLIVAVLPLKFKNYAGTDDLSFFWSILFTELVKLSFIVLKQLSFVKIKLK